MFVKEVTKRAEISSSSPRRAASREETAIGSIMGTHSNPDYSVHVRARSVL